MLDSRINTFLSVCRHMNYTKAATELHITQPTVTQHIQYLEQNYQVKLFDYTRHHLTLTEAGKQLRRMAMSMQYDVNMLKRYLARTDLWNCSLSFGATATITEYGIVKSLSQFLNDHSGLNVQLKLADSKELLQELDKGRIDFAMIEGGFDKDKYDGIPFFQDRLVACCGPEYGIKNEVEFADLMGRRLLLCEKGARSRQLLEQCFAERSLRLDEHFLVAELGTPDLVKQVAISNKGVAFLYESVVREDIAAHRLREIKIRSLSCSDTFYFLWRGKSVYGNTFRSLCGQLCAGGNKGEQLTM